MSEPSNPALVGTPLSAYLHYAIPSVAGLLAWSAASIIDGLFIANFVGVEGLAAVNLLIPVFTVAFGISYMISIGGSVRAGKYIGEENKGAANNIFSKTVIVGLVYSLVFVVAGFAGSEILYRFLGASPALYGYMHDYFGILLWFFPVQVLSIVYYYYVRIAGFPRLASAAIIVGTMANITLNYLLIGVLELGLQGAAFGTGISAILMTGVLLLHKRIPDSWLEFSLVQSEWKEMLHACYNGISEFIDEISAGVITFVLNLIVIGMYGERGVAAFSVVSYSLFIGILFFFGLSEAFQAVCSQCYGARNAERIKQFLSLTVRIAAVSAMIFSGLLLVFGNVFIGFFIDSSEVGLIGVAQEFISILWPIFFFNGMNVIIIAYLTAIHRPSASAIVAMLRAFVLPLSLLYILIRFFPDIPFLAAITAGEMLAFLIAGWLLLAHRPSSLFPADRKPAN